MTKTPESIETPKWDAVVLICKQCGKRKNGPLELRAKALVKLARVQLKGERPRPRVMSTSCMGLCPKDAIAVAWVGRGLPPRTLSIETREAFDAAIPRLTRVGPAKG